MKAGLYARVSTDQQADEGQSIQAQLRALQEHAKKRNYTVVGTYVDDGVSGSLFNERDELQRLLSDVKAGKIDIVCFVKLDRWFRSVRHYVNTQAILDEHGVVWETVWERYETVSPQGRLMVTQMLAFAEFECSNTSLRINKTFDYKKQNHEVLSGKVPFGYTIKDKHLVIDPDKSHIVREVFHTYIDTGSMCETLRLTQGNGLPTTQRALKLLLQNRKYIGECYGIENYHEPIIERNTFDEVQSMLKHNIKKSQVRYYIFSGMIFCAECGKRIIGNTDVVKKTGVRYKIYKCSGRYRTLRICENNRSINEKKLEEYLVTNLETFAFAEISVKDRKKAANYDKQITATKRKMSKLKELYVNDLITLDEYRSDLTSYQADIDRFTTEARKCKGTDKSALKDLVGRNLAEWYWELSEEERRTIWHSVIDKIWVDSNRNIQIVWK